ncbi:MAG: hypothetical protein KBC44_01400 [Candidatus Pacebacteria bacterium]|nr:hypothetical protein [Candidatus Paceibacterota bacterium]MBP9839618.1 hypothetical protein [Candidatus Paceibacterota bacterium]
MKLLKWFKKYFIPHEENNYRPHLLHHESVMTVFTFVIILELAFLVQLFVVFDKTKFLASVLPAVLTELTNEERIDNDVPVLKENPLLVQAAKAKAEDMASKGYFAHTSPEGITPWYWLKQAGYSYKSAGENLAINFLDSEDVSRAWMNSPTHRANIVKKEYTEIGIAVANGMYKGRKTIFVAQFFGTPIASTSNVTTLPKETKPSVVVKDNEEPIVEENVLAESTPVVTTELAQAGQPTNQILGEESVATNIEIPTTKTNTLKSIFQNILTSPRESVGYMYGLITVLFLLAMTLGYFVKSELRHPRTLARGVAMIAFIGILSVVNLKMLDHKTQVPVNEITANVIDALPE